MKTRIFGILLYQLIIITVTTRTSNKYLCYNNEHCTCMEENANHYFYYCGESNPHHFLVLDITQDNDTKSIKMFCVQPYDKRNYIRWVQRIYELPTKKKIKFTLQQCPLPDEPFVNIFNAFGVESVTDFIFMMTTPTAGLKTTTLEPYHFANLSSLRVLHLSFDGIEELSDNLFTDMTNLRGLHLHANRIQTLPVKIFEPLKKLKELSLFENKLTSLDGKMFQYLPRLRKLDLGKNKFDNISNSTFDSLLELRKLKLSENGMTILNDGIFDNLKNLKFLDLSENKLIRVPSTIFTNVTNLKTLLLRYAFDVDKHFKLPPQFFSTVPNLKILDLTGNNVSRRIGSFTYNGTLISV